VEDLINTVAVAPIITNCGLPTLRDTGNSQNL
jgi:hypothetical protein